MPEDYFLGHTSCPACGSSDANAMYESGNTHCFACDKTVFKTGTAGKEIVQHDRPDLSKLIWGDYRALPDRGINKTTCEKFGYQVTSTYDTETDVHIAPYHNEDGMICAQHLRYEGNKDKMPFKGTNPKTMQMFGQKQFASGGKRLVICEGEIDTMSVYQALGKGWPVVGIPGSNRVAKALKANLEFVESFEEVVLFFDNDEPGQKAVQEALEIISFGKAKYITDFPTGCKDANDILVQHGQKLLREQTFYKATEYRPDGIKEAKEIEFKPDSFTISMFPWDNFNKKLYARRGGELTVYTAGTGVGKSTILRAIYSDLLKQGEKCAAIMLEESIEETKADLMSSYTGKPIRKILAQLAVNNALAKKGKPPLFPDVETIADKELQEAENAVDAAGMILIDHSKGYNVDSILSQIRYLAVSKDVKHILLDHITLLIGSDAEIDNEVKALDVIMKKFRVLAEETGINLDIISHIRKRGNGQKSVNKGAQIAIEELRGSGSLTQIANNIITLERDQQNEDPNLTICRSLKSRLGGYTGVIGALRYNPDTGELTQEDYSDGGFPDRGQGETDY